MSLSALRLCSRLPNMSESIHEAPLASPETQVKDEGGSAIGKGDVGDEAVKEVFDSNAAALQPDLKRSLKSRHLTMLAIGGIIGPGYFGGFRAYCTRTCTERRRAKPAKPAKPPDPGYLVGIGSGLTNGGPAGLLLGFGIVGVLLWAVMQSLAEMAAFLTVSGMVLISIRWSADTWLMTLQGRSPTTPDASSIRPCPFLLVGTMLSYGLASSPPSTTISDWVCLVSRVSSPVQLEQTAVPDPTH